MLARSSHTVSCANWSQTFMTQTFVYAWGLKDQTCGDAGRVAEVVQLRTVHGVQDVTAMSPMARYNRPNSIRCAPNDYTRPAQANPVAPLWAELSSKQDASTARHSVHCTSKSFPSSTAGAAWHKGRLRAAGVDRCGSRPAEMGYRGVQISAPESCPAEGPTKSTWKDVSRRDTIYPITIASSNRNGLF